MLQWRLCTRTYAALSDCSRLQKCAIQHATAEGATADLTAVVFRDEFWGLLQALTKLFWRNPAAARPPRTWNKHEEQCLLTAVRCINVANRRAALVQSYREQVDAGADASALKSELARQLEALPAHGSMEEAAPGAGGIGDCAEDDLHDASTFSIMDWQSVAQQVGDRCAVCL